MLDRDAAKKDYAKLPRAASLGADDANPLEVTEAQAEEAEEWVARAVGSGKQLMLQRKGTRVRVSRRGGVACPCRYRLLNPVSAPLEALKALI